MDQNLSTHPRLYPEDTNSMRKLLLLPVLAGLLTINGPATAGQERWYDAEHVSNGERIFGRSCAGCHGVNGEAAADWEKTDSDGFLPPPPLNGTAHTWHHPLDALRHTVKAGGVRGGGSMPAFEGVLTDGDVDSVLAYVQSMWPDEIYEDWARRNADGDDPAPVAEPGKPDSGMITQRLSKLLPADTQVSEPLATPMSGIYEVSAGGRIIYLNEAGRYALVGDIIDLETGASLTESRRSAERAQQIAAFPDEDKIAFAATGDELAHIDVFTDTTCPYCRKLHKEIPQLQAAGVSVRYLPFPRGGNGSKGYQELSAVWCDTDPVEAMHQAKTSQIIPQNDGSCEAGSAVPAGYQLGVALGVRGTPAIILSDGRLISGYRPAANLISTLGIITK
ncbi:disulfide isomerase DsbC N-terminal domain-containing protein [Pseudomonadota bacterium]